MNNMFLRIISFLPALLNRVPHQTLFPEQLYATLPFLLPFLELRIPFFIHSCLLKVYSCIEIQLNVLVKPSQLPQSWLSATSHRVEMYISFPFFNSVLHFSVYKSVFSLFTEDKTCPTQPLALLQDICELMAWLLSPRVLSHLHFLSASPNWLKLAVESLLLFHSLIFKGMYCDSKQVQPWSESLSSAECNVYLLYLLSVLESGADSHQGPTSPIFSLAGKPAVCCILLLLYLDGI